MEQEINPEFLKGFNEGYLLQKELPQLAQQLVERIDGNSARSEGFKAGIDEMNKEFEKEHYPTWLQENRISDLEKNDYDDKDIEGPELEID